MLLEAGQIVIFPTGEANVLASAPGMRGQPDLPLYYRPLAKALPFVIDINGDSATASCRIVCGYFACDTRPFNPLLDALPRMVHVPVSGTSWGWLSALLDTALRASSERDAGQEAMLAKLSELCSSRRCGRTSKACLRTRATGSPDCATPRSAPLSASSSPRQRW